MDYDAFITRLLSGSKDSLELQLMSFTADEIMRLVDALKTRSDEHWQKKPAHSLEIGELIIEIGRSLNNGWIQTLGRMVCGDALEKLGRYADSWQQLEAAGEHFWAMGDPVGWSRTWIVRLAICVNLKRVDEALNNAFKAHEILTAASEYQKRFRLEQAVAIVLDMRGKHADALIWYGKASDTAKRIPDKIQSDLGALYSNMGVTHYRLGNLQQARDLYEAAKTIFATYQKARAVASIELNIASIDKLQGNYWQALERFRKILAVLDGHLAAIAKRSMVECYLFLNCPDEARELALEAIESFETLKMPYEHGVTLLHLAHAEMWFEDTDARNRALSILDNAESLFGACFKDQSEDLVYWRAMVNLYRAQAAFRQQNFPVALEQAQSAAYQLRQNQQQFHYGSALLVESQTRFMMDDLDGAVQQASELQRIGRKIRTPSFVYSAHLLQGQIAERQQQLPKAARQYRAAAATIDRVQQHLSVSLRPVFLEDKGDALRALIRLKLEAGRAHEAFNIMERMKSQTILSYLLHRNSLPMPNEAEDTDMRLRLEEFNQVRQRLRELMRPELLDRQIASSDRQQEIDRCESQLLALGRLFDPVAKSRISAPTPALNSMHKTIQASLNDETALVEFYISDGQIVVFVLNRRSLTVYPLSATSSEIQDCLNALWRSLKRTLTLTTNERNLRRQTDQALHALYTALLKPIAAQLDKFSRLMIVPYGFLHYVPFHLLRSSERYLIEQFEVVMLPAAGLLTRPAPARPKGALALAWSGDQKHPLVKANDEANMVCKFLGGEPYQDQKAVRTRLQTQPVKVLHIASHGKYHREPDLSYIQLADGALFTTELIQYDLSYELITLSACETGQSRPSGADELIGLGRSFIYGGAGALMTSLWRVRDDFAYEFMHSVYQGLRDGQPKATTFSHAYREMISQNPEEHPAFWGAFQFVGNPSPLSSDLSN